MRYVASFSPQCAAYTVPHMPKCASIQCIVPHTLTMDLQDAIQRATSRGTARVATTYSAARRRAVTRGAATQRNASGVNEPLQLARPRCRVTGLTVRTFTWTVSSEPCHFFMVALCNRADHYILPCYFYLLSFFIPRLISAAAGWMSTIL